MNKIILTLALTFVTLSASAANWEYMTKKSGALIRTNPEYLSSVLNKSGSKGWELVSVQQNSKQTWFFFKRKK